jgi:hypothetical protein
MQATYGEDIKIHAPTGWLSWVTLTFTRDDTKARQATFEDETNFQRTLLKTRRDAELATAYNTAPKKPNPEDYPKRKPREFCSAFDVAEIFAEAQVMHARPVRTTGLKHIGRGFGADSVDVHTQTKIPGGSVQ